MVQLMVIADDFTGALDTGVHFASKGIRTRVIVSLGDDRSWDEGLRSDQATVLVVDAETRHVPAGQAYRKVYAIVEDGKRAGIPYIYKKTDSALRGNIGSELEAAYRASGEEFLIFVPALPQMKRVTRGGIQYIDGTPVSRSVFGVDPFEPVTEDSVEKIIHLQSEIHVDEASGLDQDSWENPGIVVFDAQTEEEIRQIGARAASLGHGGLMAGCAGFASILPDLLGLERQAVEETRLEEKLFVICGSVNPITKRQLECAALAGYPRVYMTPEEKLDQARWRSEDGGPLIKKLVWESVSNDCVILDSNDPEGAKSTLDAAKEKGMDTEAVRQGIQETLGIILKKLLDTGLHPVWLVTGGDTLLGFMKEIRQWELQPVREIRPGCVLTKLNYSGQDYHIITKSGGFGEENLLLELTEELKPKQTER